MIALSDRVALDVSTHLVACPQHQSYPTSAAIALRLSSVELALQRFTVVSSHNFIWLALFDVGIKLTRSGSHKSVPTVANICVHSTHCNQCMLPVIPIRDHIIVNSHGRQISYM